MWRAILAGLLASLALPGTTAFARQPITMWFWGASPQYRRALDDALVKPFNASQNQYTLSIEYRRSVDSDVRVSAVGGGGPDLVFASGPSDVLTLARAGTLAPLDGYAQKMGWNDRLQGPLMAGCRVAGHLYCLPLSQEVTGLFYNKAVLKKYGWPVPTTMAQAEDVMRKAQAAGLYASVTGNRLWQPVNENYASVFLNGIVGPDGMACLVSGQTQWTSPRVVRAMEELKRWFRAGYLGNKDYFSLDFDTSLLLLKQGKSPFMYAPTILLQWAPKYFSGADADNIGFAPMPRLSANAPYPFFEIGAAFTYSIGAHSRVKDGAAQVLNRMLSPDFVRQISRTWPGYWAPPLKTYPTDPGADATGRLYYRTMNLVSKAVASGDYGYRTGTFLPPNTKDIFITDVEAVWLNQETSMQMLEKIQRTFDRERRLGLVRPTSRTVHDCPRILR